VAKRKPGDGVEAVLRQADATVEQWFRRSAGALRRQVNSLEAGLKKLGEGLEQLESARKAQTRKQRGLTATAGKTTRSRKQKKAA
jgi:hypothetical protein